MEKEGKWQRFTLALHFLTSSPDYTNLGMSVLCGNFFKKYADRNKTKYAAKICGIMPRLRILVKLTYGDAESDNLCGKICDMRYAHFGEMCE